MSGPSLRALALLLLLSVSWSYRGTLSVGSRDSGAMRGPHRGGGRRSALVYMADGKQSRVDDLCDSLSSVERFFGRLHGYYPVVVFVPAYEGAGGSSPLSARQMAQVRSAAPHSNVIFAPVDFNSYVSDTSLLTRAPQKWHRGPSFMPTFSMGYRHMCNFFAGPIANHPALAPYRYYWRFDTDSLLVEPVRSDPFVLMHKKSLRYGHGRLDCDWFEVTQGLYDVAVQHFEGGKGGAGGGGSISTSSSSSSSSASPIRHLPSRFRDTRCQRSEGVYSNDASWNNLVYYNNFEIVDLEFLRSSSYQGFYNATEATGGIFMERWGDAPIRTLAVLALLPPSAVHDFSTTISYYHQDYAGPVVMHIYALICVTGLLVYLAVRACVLHQCAILIKKSASEYKRQDDEGGEGEDAKHRGTNTTTATTVAAPKGTSASVVSSFFAVRSLTNLQNSARAQGVLAVLCCVASFDADNSKSSNRRSSHSSIPPSPPPPPHSSSASIYCCFTSPIIVALSLFVLRYVIAPLFCIWPQCCRSRRATALICSACQRPSNHFASSRNGPGFNDAAAASVGGGSTILGGTASTLPLVESTSYLPSSASSVVPSNAEVDDPDVHNKGGNGELVRHRDRSGLSTPATANHSSGSSSGSSISSSSSSSSARLRGVAWGGASSHESAPFSCASLDSPRGGVDTDGNTDYITARDSSSVSVSSGRSEGRSFIVSSAGDAAAAAVASTFLSAERNTADNQDMKTPHSLSVPPQSIDAIDGCHAATFQLATTIAIGGKSSSSSSSSSSFPTSLSSPSSHLCLGYHSVFALLCGALFIVGLLASRDRIRHTIFPNEGYLSISESTGCYPDELPCLLRALSDDRGRIVVTGATIGMLDFVRNLLASFYRVQVKNYLVFALDADMAAYLSAKNVPYYWDPAPLLHLSPSKEASFLSTGLLAISSGSSASGNDGEKASGSNLRSSSSSSAASTTQTFGTAAYQSITMRKNEMIGEVVRLGYSAFFTDADTVWLQNPLNEVSHGVEPDWTSSSSSSSSGSGGVKGGGGGGENGAADIHGKQGGDLPPFALNKKKNPYLSHACKALRLGDAIDTYGVESAIFPARQGADCGASGEYEYDVKGMYGDVGGMDTGYWYLRSTERSIQHMRNVVEFQRTPAALAMPSDQETFNELLKPWLPEHVDMRGGEEGHGEGGVASTRPNSSKGLGPARMRVAMFDPLEAPNGCRLKQALAQNTALLLVHANCRTGWWEKVPWLIVHGMWYVRLWDDSAIVMFGIGCCVFLFLRVALVGGVIGAQRQLEGGHPSRK